MLAGVPMLNGSAVFEGYVGEVDATVATRLLEAGAEIDGKAHCEDLCLSGGSHTNVRGPVHNPHRRGYSAGGSSSGSAALVGAGAVEMAIGGDQGGSIRMPSAFCGTVGMKPTYGLVPYTGICPIEPTVDHVGPITRERARQRAHARGDRGAGRHRLAPVGRAVAAVVAAARGRRRGPAHRRGARGLRPRRTRSPRSTPRCARPPCASRSSARASRRSRSPSTATHRRADLPDAGRGHLSHARRGRAGRRPLRSLRPGPGRAPRALAREGATVSRRC